MLDLKLVSYKLKGKPGPLRIGIVVNENVIDIQEAYRKYLEMERKQDLADHVQYVLPSDPATFLSIGFDAVTKARKAMDAIENEELDNISFNRETVTLSAPNPSPSKIICIGKNYLDHAMEMGGEVPDYPMLFAKFTNSIIGPEDNIEKPNVTEKLDYEVELAVVIGKEASNVSEAKALNHVAGYTLANDTSARDLQKRTSQFLQGKTLDNSTPIGPWIVTPDEIGDPSNLSIRSLVNGEERQSSNTSKLIFNIPYLISFISKLITLNPGDIILSGTPDGVGAGMSPPQFLKDGDTVTLEIEKIGIMENKVIEK
ncbi:fumarylacetoacetate hydrolase family protein [Virgibacillus sp. YIM 98842]|uniref:fumarylacetoacetate hydrolase family protein n=1 Tax=Virgibacillus sp. YIM 98842 TaxID=2663533 RepID=UPI003204BFE9